MKTMNFLRVMLLTTALFILASCNSDDDNPVNNPIPISSGFLKAKINGVAYANSAFFAPSATIVAGTLLIQSSNDRGNSIQIQIPNYNGAGSYNSGNGNLGNGYINYSKLGANFQLQSFTSVRGNGIVEITSVTDAEIQGTFNAMAPENIENPTQTADITEGTFKIKI